MRVKLEYIWLDGNEPTQKLRSKTKIWDYYHMTDPLELNGRVLAYNGRVIPSPDELPNWNFDGSSTNQAKGNKSDCVLKPVRIVMDPQRLDGFLVMCEVMNSDGTPHKTNKRHNLIDDPEYWFGFEQEYILTKTGTPLGFPTEGYPKPQGDYYCGLGSENVVGRDIVEEHLQVCLEANLNITGTNAEVMIGQWEYQILSKGAKKASDELWLSRFLLIRLTEKYDLRVDFKPKPVEGDWNGSGLHVNFSSDLTREVGGEEMFNSICEKLGNTHSKHMEVYGEENNKRLTGLHETQHINKFSYGVSDRGASIRIPPSTVENGWKGYLEDRRPASNADPYLLTGTIYDTLLKAEDKFRTIEV
jgi:glutamine synthetase